MRGGVKNIYFFFFRWMCDGFHRGPCAAWRVAGAREGRWLGWGVSRSGGSCTQEHGRMSFLMQQTSLSQTRCVERLISIAGGEGGRRRRREFKEARRSEGRPPISWGHTSCNGYQPHVEWTDKNSGTFSEFRVSHQDAFIETRRAADFSRAAAISGLLLPQFLFEA